MQKQYKQDDKIKGKKFKHGFLYSKNKKDILITFINTKY